MTAAFWLAFAGCHETVTRVEEPPATPTPAPTPPPIETPHPATGAQERALRLYPDLGVRGSMLNRTFLDLVEYEKHNNPKSLTVVDWPITFARRAAQMLGVQAQPDVTPSPPVTPRPHVVFVTPAPTPMRPLDRGSYNEKRHVASTPKLIYQ